MKIIHGIRLLLAAPLLGGACSGPSSPGASPLPSPATLAHLPHNRAVVAARAPWSDAALASAGLEDGGDLSAASSVYPAFSPDAPSIVSSGGPVLAHPKVVTVTWDGDPARATYEAMGAAIGASDYWRSLSEWRVGAATDGGNVHLPAPFDLTYEGVDAFVQSSVYAAPKSGWPAYTDQTIYALYIPYGANFTIGGNPFCDASYGYHMASSTPLGDGGPAPRPVVYAVIASCGGAQQAEEFATYTASVCLTGAATNPLLATNPAFATFDPAHLAEGISVGMQVEVDEIGEWFQEGIEEEPPPFDFTVGRLWSNASIAAGHNPLVPRAAGVAYYDVTTFPGELEPITVDLSATGLAGKVTTKGIKTPLGVARTFDVGFYSDAPTGAWTLSAVALPTLPIVDGSGNPIANGAVDVKIDQPTGTNGHIAHVTVTPRSASPDLKAEYIELQSGYAESSEPHSLAVLIGQ